jgi:methylaspartate ammonia-lyase
MGMDTTRWPRWTWRRSGYKPRPGPDALPQVPASHQDCTAGTGSMVRRGEPRPCWPEKSPVSEREIPYVVDVLSVPLLSTCYHDVSALTDHPTSHPQASQANPSTRAFSVGLVLSHGAVAWGDCVAESYAGRAGRDPILHSTQRPDTVHSVLRSFLHGRKMTGFRDLAVEMDALLESVQESGEGRGQEEATEHRISRREFLTAGLGRARAPREEQSLTAEDVTVERSLDSAVRYGVSQSLLKAVAIARGVTMAEVVAEEWGLPVPDSPVPIDSQCGMDRDSGVETKIARRVTPLMHTLLEGTGEGLDGDGASLTRYARWLKGRIERLGDSDYCPTIHLDAHGALGHLSDNNLGRVLGQLYALELAAKPYPLRVENPVVMESRSDQLESMGRLREYVRFRSMNVELVADEWADTLVDIVAFVDAEAADMIHIKVAELGGLHNVVDAVLACKGRGVGVLLGGTCVETDVSTRAMAHVALATRPDVVLVRSGMGAGRGLELMQNEMTRSLMEIAARALRRS